MSRKYNIDAVLSAQKFENAIGQELATKIYVDSTEGNLQTEIDKKATTYILDALDVEITGANAASFIKYQTNTNFLDLTDFYNYTGAGGAYAQSCYNKEFLKSDDEVAFYLGAALTGQFFVIRPNIISGAVISGVILNATDISQFFKDYKEGDIILLNQPTKAKRWVSANGGTGGHLVLGKLSSSGTWKAGEGVKSVITEGDAEEGFARGNYSVAEGFGSKTTGNYAHAEGISTQAIGVASHTEGSSTITNGDYSHAEGFGTVTNSEAEHAQGKYNISRRVVEAGQDRSTLSTIGIGSSAGNARNAFEMLMDGTTYLLDIGNYDGTNGGTSAAKSVQDVLNSKQEKLVFADEDEFPYSEYNAVATEDYLEDRITVRCLTKTVPQTIGDYVYGVNNTGATPKFPTTPISADNVSNTIVKRDNGGRIKAKNPVDSYDVVTKYYFDQNLSIYATQNYVDQAVAGKINTITLTQAEFDALTEYADNTNYQII